MSRPFSAYWKQISLDTQAQKQFLWNESPDQGWASEKGFQQVAGRKETRQWDRRYCLLFYFVALIVECFLISQEFLDFVNFLQRFCWEKKWNHAQRSPSPTKPLNVFIQIRFFHGL